MISLSFYYPKLLFLLFLIPIFVIIYFLSFNYHKKRAINFPNFDAMQRVFGAEIFSRNFLSLYINMTILLFVVLAAAGTVVLFDIQSRGPFVIAIDNSESMNTADVLPNRLEAAKLASKRFISFLPAGTEVGVLEFSGRTNVLHELDASKFEANMVIDLIEVSNDFGTDMDEVLYNINFLMENKEKKQAIILSDGQLTSSDLNKTIKYAVDNNIKVYAILVGTEIGALTELGTISKADKYTMQKIAFETKGEFFETGDLDSLEASFNSIFSESNEKSSLNISLYLLIISLVLFCINWVLNNFRFRTIP